MLKVSASDYKFFEKMNVSKGQINRTIGANIRKKRNELGITMKVLADLAGMAVSAIASLENGLRVKDFTPYELHRVADALGVSIDSLYEGIDECI